VADAEELIGMPAEKLLQVLKTSESGLSPQEVKTRLETYGPNEFAKKKKRSGASAFLFRLTSPLVLILLFASFVSLYLGDVPDFSIIFTIILISVALDTYQESKASRAAELLKKKVTTTATVIRNGTKQEVDLSEIVPGDMISVIAGDIIPADARILKAKDLFIDQSALTGESFPIEKEDKPLQVKKGAALTDWDNFLFMGTSVISGTGTAAVANTGSSTEYGKIAKRLVAKEPETEFESGIRRFGFLMMEFTLVLVVFVFFMNSLFGRGILKSLLFAVALAVGLTPELLPMIITINLSKGALEMSNKGVIVKRLSSIQNFGSMDVLCTDKTGTLTKNEISLVLHVDVDSNDSDKVLTYSYLNSFYETGLKSPLDDAVLRFKRLDIRDYAKIDEIPFDFTRKRVSIVVERKGEQTLLTKGAPEEVVKVCTKCESKGQVVNLTESLHDKIEQSYKHMSSQGFRVLGVSYKKFKEKMNVCKVGDECDMVFLGLIAFMDPPKETAAKTLKDLKKAGIELKILTGDNELVTKKVCQDIGFEITGIVMGDEIYDMRDDALARVVEQANIFARVTPSQKDRIMNALRSHGHVVGFLGDGINDAPSIKTADVGISVNNAVDVAKESADIILLHKSLQVLNQGVLEGRKTFGNTIKYIRMGTSSNFGNMFSVAGASIILPTFFGVQFLPMEPTQILLNNLLYDLSETTIPTDRVDKEYIATPKRLDVAMVRKFMIFFGPLSSIFDFLTFFIMLFVFNAWKNAPLFQTAWFVESFFTQTLVIFVIRTRKVPFFRSRPSLFLTLSSLLTIGVALVLPWIPQVGGLFGFIPLPLIFFVYLAVLTVTYLLLVELVKRWFYRRYGYRAEQTSVSKSFAQQTKAA
jgi:Mg2+-importing ATPase